MENLDHLHALEELTLGHNQITKMEGLETLRQMKNLYLRDNQIARIECLGELRDLQKLYLQNNRIVRVEGLDSQAKLERLNLDGNPLVTPATFPALPALRELGLSGCGLATPPYLAGCPVLTHLDLSYNACRSVTSVIQALPPNHHIEFLDLRLCPIADWPLNAAGDRVRDPIALAHYARTGDPDYDGPGCSYFLGDAEQWLRLAGEDIELGETAEEEFRRRRHQYLVSTGE